MDAVVGAFLMTQPGTQIGQGEMNNFVLAIKSTDQLPTIQDRLEKHYMDPLTGRALFSALLPADFEYTVGDVIIREGVLIQGIIKKDHIGTTSGSIVLHLYKNYGTNRAVEFISDLTHVVDQWLTTFGFSVGLEACLPKDPRHQSIVNEEIAKAKLKAQALGPAPSDPLEKERHERKIISYVRAVTDVVGKRVIEEEFEKEIADKMRKRVDVDLASELNAKRKTLERLYTQEEVEKEEPEKAPERVERLLIQRQVNAVINQKLQQHLDKEKLDRQVGPEEEAGIRRRFLNNEVRDEIGRTLSPTDPNFEPRVREWFKNRKFNEEIDKRIQKNLDQVIRDRVPTRPEDIPALLAMARSGSKGTEFHIAQIFGLLGQQFVEGARQPLAITQGTRSLPYFDPDEPDLESRGFAIHSFAQVMNPAEFFYHQAGTRVGLTDTSIKTAETGTTQRRLIKSLEDLVVAYDGSVRNANNVIYQMVYGDVT